MTEKLFTGTLNKNQNKQKEILILAGNEAKHDRPGLFPVKWSAITVLNMVKTVAAT